MNENNVDELFSSDEIDKVHEEEMKNLERREDRIKIESLELEVFKLERENKKLIENQERLAAKEKELLENERKVKELKIEILRNEKNFDTREKELKEKELKLNEREKSVIERESNAELGFLNENSKALKLLREEKEKLSKEILEKKSSLMKEEEKLIESRGIRAAKLEEDMASLLKAKNKELEDKYNEKAKDLGMKIEDFQKEKERILELERKLEMEKNNLKREYLNLSVDKECIELDRSKILEKIATENERYKATIQGELDGKDQLVDFFKNKNRELEEEIRKHENLQMRRGGKSIEEIQKAFEDAALTVKELRNQLASMPSEFERREAQVNKEEVEKLKRENKAIIDELLSLKNREQNWLIAHGELQNLQLENEILKKKFKDISDIYNLRMNMFSEELNKFRVIYGDTEAIGSRIGAIEKPYFPETFIVSDTSDSELDWLDEIYKSCVNSGFLFNKRLLHAFHTSLKTSEWSPLTVLAGVSGTGKSALPNLYSKFGGLFFLLLPVQPDWDSPQSLFGFFNSVDNRFNATTLLRTLVQAENSLKDNVILVLLDEMNLAHVELYFSEMLSKLEARRDDGSATLEIDLGAGLERYSVKLQKNLLWIGTMNEDETTKSLSDKVIDRGNLITFPKPTKFQSRSNSLMEPSRDMLPKARWEKWKNEKINFSDEIVEYKDALEEINKTLGNIGRALGHRVWQAVENYMGNHPLVIHHNKKEDKKMYKEALKIAFEDALVHKVMPKLRGIELRDESFNSLKDIGNIINEKASGLSSDYKRALKHSYGVFIWSSSEYLNNYLEKDNNG